MSISTIPSSSELFYPRKHFIVNIHEADKVKIVRLNEHFEVFFLSKLEGLSPISNLYGRNIGDRARDTSLLKELGREKAVTTLYDIFCMLEKQPNGEGGALLNDGNSNIFYVSDVHSNLRVVGVCFHSLRSKGWTIDSYPIGTYPFVAGRRVFSHGEQLAK